MRTTGKTETAIRRKMRATAATLLAVALALGLAAFPAGCSSPGGGAAERTDAAAIADRVWAFGQAHPDGFTIDVRTMAEPSEGIAVSYAATQGSHSREALGRVVDHALRHDGYAGGWYNPENGLYYFDSTRLFPEDRLEDALRFGRENGQHEVYILSTGTEVPVDAGEPAR
jgi:hypothetical protein